MAARESQLLVRDYKRMIICGILVNIVPREFQGQKPEGAAGPEGFGRRTSQGTPFTMILANLFHTLSFLSHPGLVKRDFFQPLHYADLGDVQQGKPLPGKASL